MLTEKEIHSIAEPMVLSIENINAQFISKFSKHISRVVKKRNVDFMQEYEQLLQNMAFLLGLFDDYYFNQSKYMENVIKSVSQKDYKDVKDDFIHNKIEYVAYKDNKPLNDIANKVSNNISDDIYNAKYMLGLSVTENGKTKGIYLPTAYILALQKAMMYNQSDLTDDFSIGKLLNSFNLGNVKVIYPSGKTIRLDNYMNFVAMGGLQEFAEQNSIELGNQFGSTGYEISVHDNPAPDHADIQGQQYTAEEYEELNNELARPIGEINCYHFAIPIIYGFDKPLYTKEELQEIKDNAERKISVFGKEYTRYECSQLCRRYENRIKHQKEEYISAINSNNRTNRIKSEDKIDILSRQYKYLCKKSNLPIQEQNIKVKGYKKD